MMLSHSVKMLFKSCFLLLTLIIGNISQFSYWFTIILSPVVLGTRFGVSSVYNKRFLWIYGFFITWILITAVLSFHLEWPVKRIISMTSCFLVMLNLSIYIKNDKNLNIVLRSFLKASILFSLVLLALTYKGGYVLDVNASNLVGKNSSAPALFLGFFIATVLKNNSDNIIQLVLLQFWFMLLIIMTTALKIILPTLLILMIDIFFMPSVKRSWYNSRFIKLCIFVSISSIIVAGRFWSHVVELVEVESRIVALFGGEPELSFARSVTNHREELAGLGMDILRSNYILGVGLENTRLFFGTYTHNSFLEVAIGSGIFGILLYIAIFMLWWKEVLRVKTKRLKYLVLVFFLSVIFISTAQRMYDNLVLSILVVFMTKMHLWNIPINKLHD